MDLTVKEFLPLEFSTTMKYTMKVKFKYYTSKSQGPCCLHSVSRIVQNHAKYLKKQTIYVQMPKHCP